MDGNTFTEYANPITIHSLVMVHYMYFAL